MSLEVMMLSVGCGMPVLAAATTALYYHAGRQRVRPPSALCRACAYVLGAPVLLVWVALASGMVVFVITEVVPSPRDFGIALILWFAFLFAVAVAQGSVLVYLAWRPRLLLSWSLGIVIAETLVLLASELRLIDLVWTTHYGGTVAATICSLAFLAGPLLGLPFGSALRRRAMRKADGQVSDSPTASVTEKAP